MIPITYSLIFIKLTDEIFNFRKLELVKKSVKFNKKK